MAHAAACGDSIATTAVTGAAIATTAFAAGSIAAAAVCGASMAAAAIAAVAAVGATLLHGSTSTAAASFRASSATAAMVEGCSGSIATAAIAAIAAVCMKWSRRNTQSSGHSRAPWQRGLCTTEYLGPFFKKIKRTAQTKLGPGDIGIWLDNATVHKACKPLLEKLFQPVVFQPPLSPDTNLCDAGVFVNMANMANNEEPNTQEGIRKAAKKTWNKITPAHLKKVSNRVRGNMKMIEKLEGGNWYIEGQK